MKLLPALRNWLVRRAPTTLAPVDLSQLWRDPTDEERRKARAARVRLKRGVKRARGPVADDDFECEPCVDRFRLRSAARFLRESLHDHIAKEWSFGEGRYFSARAAADSIVNLLIDIEAVDYRGIARRMDRL